MPAGAPLKLTQTIVDEVPEVFGGNPTITGYSAVLGIYPGTIRRWVKAGVKVQRKVDGAKRGPVELLPDEYLCYQFCIALKRALAQVEAEAFGSVRNAGNGWQASAWILERRFAETWGRGRALEAELKKLIRKVEKERSLETGPTA